MTRDTPDDRAKRLQKRRRDDWKFCIGDPRALRVLGEVLELADPFQPGRRDEFAAGERNVTLKVANAMLEADLNAVAAARTELKTDRLPPGVKPGTSSTDATEDA